ncbi:MAG: acetyl-CoA carboxylase biotin carboxyl carrier protein [Phycisphaerales bacterium]|nr:MAG: acetyl-CoA carboxylase biotin carboxyl carrier protein [Phycisphaerales bacterium]
MIDIRKLKELVRLMVANELTELDLRDSEEQVTLRRDRRGGGLGPGSGPQEAAASGGASGAAAVQAAPAQPEVGKKAAAATAPETDLITIASPMVGTFYAAPSPDASEFVREGSSVAPGTVVCIIEAMKIFNEIKAECAGTIVKIMVSNGDPVEFDQPLFTVRPI